VAKAKTTFVCEACGSVTPKWAGKCPACGEWDTLSEHRHAGAAAADPQRGAAVTEAAAAVRLGDVSTEADTAPRIATGIGEFDRVLGGGRPDHGKKGGKKGSGVFSGAGLVPGAAVLIGGDPGIGKSTLMLDAAARLAESGQRVLYVTSEESPRQLRLRAARLLGTDRKTPDQLYVLGDTNLARIVEQCRRLDPAVVIVDSVQMIYKADLAAAPGSVTQLRACCLELVYHAKSSGAAVLLVGHVTKRGSLAGPKLLEHMVDAVLHFEGDRYHHHRVLRGVKNRFGTTLEVGLFEMTDRGLVAVSDGAGLLAAEYQPRAGSAVCPVLQGTRVLLVELQALTATGFLGSAKRKASGVDRNRLAVLIAVLEKRGGLRLADQDIFAASIGGLKVAEPAADLALALAIAGSHYGRQLDHGTCAVGEIGLGGEVRHVQQLERRVHEAARLGFRRVLCPPTKVKAGDAEVVPVRRIEEALEQLH